MKIDGTLLVQLVNFIILVILLAKFAYKPIMKVLHERQAKIANSIESAENDEQKAKQVLAEYQKQLADARIAAQSIVDKAAKRAQEEHDAYIEQIYKIFPEFICMLYKENEDVYILYSGCFYFNISVFSSFLTQYKNEFDDKIKLYIDNLMEVKGSFGGTIDFTIHSETLDIIYNNINTLDLFISQSKYDEIQALITVINSNYNRLSYSDSPEEDALVVKALKVIMDNVTIKDGITSENSFLCKL